MTRTVIINGSVFDGTGAPPGNADIAIEDGLIVEVGTGLDGDESIDCGGHLITPGLIDCHVHFMADGDLGAGTHANTPFSMNFFQAAERMQRTLDCGITTVREAGGSDLGLKEARDTGLIAGPKMQPLFGVRNDFSASRSSRGQSSSRATRNSFAKRAS